MDLRDKIAEKLMRACAHLDDDPECAEMTADAVMRDVVTPELEQLRDERIISCVFAVRSGECPLPFALYRRTDVTGVSGEGTVAYGVQFADGTVVIRWLGDYASTVVWDDLEKAMQVHGHRGSTRVVWLAEEFEDLAEIEAKAERAEQAEAERDALKAAIDFLYARQVHDGSGVSFSAQRCRGRSSDALAWYGAGMRDEPHRDEYPLDGSDLAACERTLTMAPAHIAERMKPVIERYRAALDTPTPTEETDRGR